MFYMHGSQAPASVAVAGLRGWALYYPPAAIQRSALGVLYELELCQEEFIRVHRKFVAQKLHLSEVSLALTAAHATHYD